MTRSQFVDGLPLLDVRETWARLAEALAAAKVQAAIHRRAAEAAKRNRA